MKVIYTKETYKLDNKYKVYWSKVGYICNDIHRPHIRITTYTETINEIRKKNNKPLVNVDNYLISVYDIQIYRLLKKLNKLFPK